MLLLIVLGILALIVAMAALRLWGNWEQDQAAGDWHSPATESEE